MNSFGWIILVPCVSTGISDIHSVSLTSSAGDSDRDCSAFPNEKIESFAAVGIASHSGAVTASGAISETDTASIVAIGGATTIFSVVVTSIDDASSA